MVSCVILAMQAMYIGTNELVIDYTSQLLDFQVWNNNYNVQSTAKTASVQHLKLRTPSYAHTYLWSIRCYNACKIKIPRTFITDSEGHAHVYNTQVPCIIKSTTNDSLLLFTLYNLLSIVIVICWIMTSSLSFSTVLEDQWPILWRTWMIRECYSQKISLLTSWGRSLRAWYTYTRHMWCTVTSKDKMCC